MTNKKSVIYSYSCGRIDCEEEYIGESGRTFGERFKEHLKALSPLFGHQNSSGHDTTMENFKIIGREENSLARTIKESMYIRLNSPTLNKNIGKYNLPHIWDRVLYTGGSRLSRTTVNPDSRLAQIFVAKFLCIFKLITIIG